MTWGRGIAAVVIIALVVPTLIVVTHTSDDYASGDLAFTAGFPTSPKQFLSPNWEMGRFTASAFKSVRIWSADGEGVLVAPIRAPRAKVVEELLATSKLVQGRVRRRDGVLVMTFHSHVRNGGDTIAHWYDGLIELRGSQFFYALGTGSSLNSAQEFIRTFHVLPA